MVAPVTGPFNRSVVRKGPTNRGGFTPDWYSKNQQWFRQRKPYDRPLGYVMSERQVLYSSNTWDYNTSYTGGAGANSALHAAADNKAYSKLVGKLGEKSLWAVNLLEANQAMAMIAGRAIQITRFARALNRFDFSRAAKALEMAKVPKNLKNSGKTKSKSLSNNWLEFHFGWVPLVQDIGAAVNTLQQPIPPQEVKAGGGAHSFVTVNTGSFGSINNRVNNVGVRKGCHVSVTNPNLWLANQLGFVNPLTVAWELIPFSFVVDWFVNVGDFLASYTDFAGASVSAPWSTRFEVAFEDALWYHGLTNRWLGVYLQRTASISGPTLRARPWNGVSPVRAATAVSLLVQQLR